MTEAFGAFAGFGIEIEYMIVRSDDLGVAPIADHVLEEAEGEITNETEQGSLAWSNELALHVIELKTNGRQRIWRAPPAISRPRSRASTACSKNTARC